MVPLSNRLTIIILALGLVVGIIGGLVYWQITPINSPPPVYQSIVTLEPIPVGSTYSPVHDMQQLAEFWAYILRSSPFLDFVNAEQVQEVPSYSHSAKEMAKMITVRVVYTDIKTTVEVHVNSPVEAEALDVAKAIPELLVKYLVTGEVTAASAAYNNELIRLDSLNADLDQAQKELADATTKAVAAQRDLRIEHTILTAMVSTLQAQLTELAEKQASFIASSSTGEENESIAVPMQRVAAALEDAKVEQADIERQLGNPSGDLSDSAAYMEAKVRVSALLRQINDLTVRLTAPSSEQTIKQQLDAQIFARDPSLPIEVPPDKVRGRTAIMMGAVIGIAVAFLVLNRKPIIDKMRGFKVTEPKKNKGDD